MNSPHKALVIYRANTIFDEIVPFVEKGLSTLGYITIPLRFATRTPEEMLVNWFRVRKPSIQTAELIISDGTCDRALFQNQLSSSRFTLDELAENVVLNIIEPVGEGVVDEQSVDGSLQKTREAYVHMFTHLTQKPEQLHILEEHLTDHDPFCYLLPKGLSNMYISDERRKYNAHAARILKSWFEEGIGCHVDVIANRKSLPIRSVRNDLSKQWVLLDRHNLIHETLKSDGYFGAVLLLPLPNFVQDVLKAGIYQSGDFKEKQSEQVERFVKKFVSPCDYTH